MYGSNKGNNKIEMDVNTINKVVVVKNKKSKKILEISFDLEKKLF